MTGDLVFISDLASSAVNRLLPTINIPGFPSSDKLSFLANQPMENPCATTVKNTRANVKVSKIPASSYPAFPNKLAKYPETVNATFPLGAIQATNVLSLSCRSVPIVDKKMERGRTANIINKTYPIILGLKICNKVSTCKEAVNMMKIAEINKIDISSLK